MSLAPKIDEVAYAIVSNDIDVAMFAETWLKDSIPDQAIAVAGYRLLRRDRTLKSHGGVCIYVKNSIYCHPLNDFYSDDFEVHWSLLRPYRLPRGISNVIVAVVYHPPNSDNS